VCVCEKIAEPFCYVWWNMKFRDISISQFVVYCMFEPACVGNTHASSDFEVRYYELSHLKLSRHKWIAHWIAWDILRLLHFSMVGCWDDYKYGSLSDNVILSHSSITCCFVFRTLGRWHSSLRVVVMERSNWHIVPQGSLVSAIHWTPPSHFCFLYTVSGLRCVSKAPACTSLEGQQCCLAN